MVWLVAVARAGGDVWVTCWFVQFAGSVGSFSFCVFVVLNQRLEMQTKVTIRVPYGKRGVPGVSSRHKVGQGWEWRAAFYPFPAAVGWGRLGFGACS